MIGTLMSSKLATLYELQTVYGVEDGYNLLEIVLVDSNNQRRIREKEAHNANRN